MKYLGNIKKAAALAALACMMLVPRVFSFQSGGIEIDSAVYGTDAKHIDVMSYVQKMVTDGAIKIPAKMNEAFGIHHKDQDPAHGVVKDVKVHVKLPAGRGITVVGREHEGLFAKIIPDTSQQATVIARALVAQKPMTGFAPVMPTVLPHAVAPVPMNLPADFYPEDGLAKCGAVGSTLDSQYQAFMVDINNDLYRLNIHTMADNPWVKIDAKDAQGNVLKFRYVATASDGTLVGLDKDNGNAWIRGASGSWSMLETGDRPWRGSS